MVSLGDEQDPWAPRGREEQSHGSSCPTFSIPNSPGKAAELLVKQIQKIAVSTADTAQHKQEPQNKGGGTISGSQTRISPRNLLALLTVLVHTEAERHCEWRCTFFAPASWERW